MPRDVANRRVWRRRRSFLCRQTPAKASRSCATALAPRPATPRRVRARSLSAGRRSLLQPDGCGHDRDGARPFRGRSDRRCGRGQPAGPARTGALDPRAERGRATRRGRRALRAEPRRRRHRQARNRARRRRARSGPACADGAHRRDVATARNETQGAAHWTPARLYHAAGEVAARVALLARSADRAWRRPAACSSCSNGRSRPRSAIASSCAIRAARARSAAAASPICGPAAPAPHAGTARAAPRAARDDPDAGTRGRAVALAVLHRPLRVRARPRTRGERRGRLLEAVPHVRLADGNAIALSQDDLAAPRAWVRTALETSHRAHPELPGALAGAVSAPSSRACRHALRERRAVAGRVGRSHWKAAR